MPSESHDTGGRSRRRLVLLTVSVLGVTGSLAGLGTYAAFTSTATVPQASITSGVVTNSIPGAGPSNRLTLGASDIVPGDTMQRAVDLENTGHTVLAAITLTTTATPSSLLDTSLTNGLQMAIDECSQPWTESGVAPAFDGFIAPAARPDPRRAGDPSVARPPVDQGEFWGPVGENRAADPMRWARANMPGCLGVAPCVVAATVAVQVIGARPASATFTGSPSVSQGAISSATLLPATAMVAKGGCQPSVPAPEMALTWTQTTSTSASGYEIVRSDNGGGPYAPLSAVSGWTTTSYTDTSATAAAMTYYYVLQTVTPD